jgi:hypothetical protein
VSERTDTSDEATRAESEARGAELREELATTDLRRAEEEEAKAEQAIEDAREKESKKERKRREAEERRVAAAAEADAAREQPARRRAGAPPSPQASVGPVPRDLAGRRLGTDPSRRDGAAAARAPQPRSVARAVSPDKPELRGRRVRGRDSCSPHPQKDRQVDGDHRQRARSRHPGRHREAQLLVREEIALAKAEMTEKVTKLAQGRGARDRRRRLRDLRPHLPARALSWGCGSLTASARATGSGSSSPAS